MRLPEPRRPRINESGVASMEMAVDRHTRRMIGAYYTPDDVAGVLVRWANPNPSGRVLDPSFGGCSFLNAALNHAHNGGMGSKSVYGVDIDNVAFAYAAELTLRGLPSRNLVQRSFFDVEPESVGGQFAAVVGNPPYIRHHWLTEEQVSSAQSAAIAAGVVLPRTSDTWAYFVAHATSFLIPGGRLAFVLPEALTFAHYAVPLVEKLKTSFGQVSVIRLSQRIFAGTQANCVVLACDDYGNSTSGIAHASVSGASALDQTLSHSSAMPMVTTPSKIATHSLTWTEKEAWHNAVQNPRVCSLETVAIVRLGVVTGANDFFICSGSRLSELQDKSCELKPIVTRAKDIRQVVLCAEDLYRTSKSESDKKLLVIRGAKEQLPPNLIEMIDEAERRELHLRYHTSRRERWYEIKDTRSPDAFVPYMGVAPYPMTLNSASATSSNGVHRIWWQSELGTIEDAVVGSWTSIYRLSAEMAARHYGGGVVKIEPGAAKKIRLPVVDGAAKVLGQLDLLVRAERRAEASALADKFVLGDLLGMTPQVISGLRSASERLSNNRQKVYS